MFVIHFPSSEYGEFLHCNDTKFYDFDAIRAEILTQTAHLCGTNRGITNVPINLRIYSPNVFDLTLIDLPGITKNPVGEQPDNIEIQIKEMIYQFISNKNCLILAVSAANYDLANSDALKMARDVDKDGLRTIGVITKLDLMDKGTNAKDIFDGNILPLRHGYIGVINRSQHDIDTKKDFVMALEHERNYFLGHPYYRTIRNRLGTQNLQEALNKLLSEHIRRTLPSFEEAFRIQLALLETDIAEFRNMHPDDPSNKTTMVK